MKRNLQFMLTALFLGSLSQHVLAGNWWDTNFEQHSPQFGEEGGAGNWAPGGFVVNPWTAPTPYSITNSSKARSGANSFRFELRPGDCGHGFPPYSEGGNVHGDCLSRSERAELSSTSFDDHGDAWYAWSIYHQNYQFLNNVSPIHGQFKHVNGDGCGGGSSRSACIAMFLVSPSGMQVHFDAFQEISPTIIPAGQLNNKWNDIRVHTKWSVGADGIFQVWVNGKLKLDRRGANLRPGMGPHRFRFGIYRPQVNRANNNHTQVVYYDEVMRGNSCQSVSQFMTCPGGGGSTGTGTGSSDSADGSTASLFETYVNAYGDLNAAFNNGLKPGKTKAEFGQWHYCAYGNAEGRTSAGISLDICAASLDSTTPDINSNVDEMEDSLSRGRFTDEITTGIRSFSRIAVFNGEVFSFKDYYTFKAYEVNDTQGLMLGFSKKQKSDGTTDDPVGVGWLFDNVALMVAQDNSMLGYDAKGIFDFKDPSTTYIDIGHRKKFADNITLFTDLIYAYGRSNDGDLVKLSDIHALGFESKLEYVANDTNTFVFRFDLPLHIEDGSSRFIVSQFGQPVPLNIDLVPDGREMRLSLGNNFRLFDSSMITSRFMYTRDPDHRQSSNDYQFDIRYRVEY